MRVAILLAGPSEEQQSRTRIGPKVVVRGEEVGDEARGEPEEELASEMGEVGAEGGRGVLRSRSVIRPSHGVGRAMEDDVREV